MNVLSLSKTVHVADPHRKRFTLCGLRWTEKIAATRITCRTCSRLDID